MRNLWILIFLAVVFPGCIVNQTLQEEIDVLKKDQVELREQAQEHEQKLKKMEIALENSLRTVLKNKGNIGIVYKIIKNLVAIVIDEKVQNVDNLRALLKVAEQMSDQSKPKRYSPSSIPKR